MSIELVLLGEIMTLSGEPDTSLDEFGEKVATSPQLAAEVVRLSNSSLYGMEGKINRLERAVLILGMRTVATVASALLVAKRMRAIEGAVDGDVLWLHSLESGLSAQFIARCLSIPLESEAYLAGLLHDLGIPELSESFPDRYTEVVQRSQSERVALTDLEQETFGENHSQRLMANAKDWGFPEHLAAAIGHHDHPLEAPEAGRTLALLVRAAHIIVVDPEQGWNDIPPGPEDEEILGQLALGPDEVQDIRELLAEKLKEVAPLFR